MEPYSQSCENNKAPILTLLQPFFDKTSKVVEIGSGTGQHAVYFAPRLPHLIWQTSDLPDNHAGINRWIHAYPAQNLLPPLPLNVTQAWPVADFDGVYTANTLHIMPWEAVEALFGALHSPTSCKLAIYGPFNYEGKFTSESNAEFDLWLKERAPHQGIRDIEKITALAREAGFTLVADNPMPANNRLLFFQK